MSEEENSCWSSDIVYENLVNSAKIDEQLKENDIDEFISPSSFTSKNNKIKISLSQEQIALKNRSYNVPKIIVKSPSYYENKKSIQIQTPTIVDESGRYTESYYEKLEQPKVPVEIIDESIELPPKSVPRLLDKSMICEMCQNPYCDPRVLDCLHTFCYKCLFYLMPIVLKNKEHVTVESKLQMLSAKRAQEHESNLSSDRRRGRRSSFNLHPLRKIEIKIKERRNSLMELVNTKSERAPGTSSLKKEIGEKPIKCPICEYVTELPSGGVSRLPSNYIILNKSKQNITCSLCCDAVNAIGFCIICRIHLCNFCKEAHLRQRTTSQHQIRLLDDESVANLDIPFEDDDFDAILRNPKKCTIHKMFDVKSFCTQCFQVACNHCTIFQHKGHKCEPIAKSQRIYKKTLKTSITLTNPLPDYVNDSISKLSIFSEKVNQRSDNIQRDVDQFFEDYLAAIDNHRLVLKTQIERIREQKLKTISEQQVELVKRSNDAKALLQFTEQILADCNDIEFLTTVGVLLRRFEYCQKSKASLDLKLSDAIQFIANIRAPVTAAQNGIPMFGIITTQIAIPHLCSLIDPDGLTFLRVHRKVELFVQAKDCDEMPMCHGGLQLQAVVKYEDVTRRELPIEVQDNRDGTYGISFVPDAAGTMSLSITTHGQHIQGSPFALCARTLRPHSGIFHCCVFCSTRGSKVATCACGGQMPGYKGCGHGHNDHPGARHWSCCASLFESSECSATNTFRN